MESGRDDIGRGKNKKEVIKKGGEWEREKKGRRYIHGNMRKE